GKARGEYKARSRGQREERLGERGEAVADGGEALAVAPAVGEHAREHLHHHRGGFRHAFDQAHDEGARAEPHGEVEREQGVDHLRGEIHQQAHEPEYPDAPRDGGARLRHDGIMGPVNRARGRSMATVEEKTVEKKEIQARGDPVDKISVTRHRAKVGKQMLAYTVTCGTLVLREEAEKEGKSEGEKARAKVFFI